MSVALSDLNACQHVIRILTDDPGIEIVSVRTQYVISKVVSHGARLDALAEDKKGVICHLEIEGADVADHPRRTRFYGALTDSELLRKGDGYGALPDRRIFYISRTDIWKKGYTVYEEEKRFRQTGFDDGEGELSKSCNADSTVGMVTFQAVCCMLKEQSDEVFVQRVHPGQIPQTFIQEAAHMDQKKTGGFIAERRRELNLTQKDLADKLGITDRAVSKWENGRCMPDFSAFLYSFRYRTIRERMSLIITFAGIFGTAASLIAFIVRTW